MSLIQRLRRFGIDSYLLLLLGTVFLATVLPASGAIAGVVKTASLLGIALLFFLYGAKLNTAAVIAGIANWRLQLLVLGATYLAFPLLTLLLWAGLAPWIDPNVALGLLFLGVLPSTVQSSIAFTGLAQGNVPAAVCAASLSNLIGVVLTPALCAFLLHTSSGGVPANAIGSIALQILLPFGLGQLARPWIGALVARHRTFTITVDRGSILLIVYSAFSAGMVSGVWGQIGGSTLALIIGGLLLLLFLVVAGTLAAGRLARLPREDRMALIFCGSTKSLATGVPMAGILFADQAVSLIILPLMLYHQLQLIVCAILAQRQATLIADGAAAAALPSRA